MKAQRRNEQLQEYNWCSLRLSLKKKKIHRREPKLKVGVSLSCQITANVHWTEQGKAVEFTQMQDKHFFLLYHSCNSSERSSMCCTDSLSAFLD